VQVRGRLVDTQRRVLGVREKSLEGTREVRALKCFRHLGDLRFRSSHRPGPSLRSGPGGRGIAVDVVRDSCSAILCWVVCVVLCPYGSHGIDVSALDVVHNR